MCQIYKSELHCEKDLFFCGHAVPEYMKCIPDRWTCDGVVDCPNSSDEGLLCHKGKGKIGTELCYFGSNIYDIFVFHISKSFSLKADPLKPTSLDVNNDSDISIQTSCNFTRFDTWQGLYEPSLLTG